MAKQLPLMDLFSYLVRKYGADKIESLLLKFRERVEENKQDPNQLDVWHADEIDGG